MASKNAAPSTARKSAKAPRRPAPASGLQFTRRNTRAGVDPYDQFAWESRDVVLRNWRDDTVTFEQYGVEFPSHWSTNASKIVTSKYFRGAVGSPERESSLRQVIDRVVGTYAAAAVEHGYMDEANAAVFADELTFALVDQQFSFNSPVWFNVGTNSPQQISACFILAVDDSMDSILDWYKEEGLIFKGGSGAGVNLSRIRSSKELLRSGGTASGPVSFMRGADASAGTIKSGGATRRAAKMVVLDVDHPDIAEFVRVKADEERKIRVLRDAGFDMDLGGKDISSVQYQNANNSVRVNDEFMRAVQSGSSYGLRARSDGSVIDEVDARELFTAICTAAWECADPGLQYDDAIQSWHTLPNSGRISASNPCSEYMSLDNSSCNLASIRLMRFFDPASGVFDIAGYEYLVRLVMTAAEISIAFGDFPTPSVAATTKAIRTIGLGYTDLGAMLMAAGAGYDSDLGRSWAAAVTSVLASVAYRTSAELSAAVGPFEKFAENRDAMLAVMGRHEKASTAALDDFDALPAEQARRSGNLRDVLAAGDRAWAHAVEAGSAHGYRNAQAVVIAPTGTISFMMDADTTGIEPGLGLVMFKKVADGSSMAIVNQTVPVALRRLGYDEAAVEAISAHVASTGSILGAPGFDPTHADVFATAMGDNVVSPMGHVRMMAAVQPFVSGAISKTINMPQSATVDDIADVYMQSWLLGLKAVAVYRDNCKVGQPLSVAGSAAQSASESDAASDAPAQVVEVPVVRRERLPRSRSSRTTSFSVAGVEGYMTSGQYEDGRLGELFMKVSKQGSTLAGIMDALSMAVSIGLQYGVPLEVYVSKYVNSRFEPAGMTDDPDLRIASSLLDYTFRRLALDYLPRETREGLGILSSAERAAELSGEPAPSPAPAAVSAPGVAAAGVDPAPAPSNLHVVAAVAAMKSDAPMCFDCGVQMQRAGSCHVCPSCASTSGCS